MAVPQIGYATTLERAGENEGGRNNRVERKRGEVLGGHGET